MRIERMIDAAAVQGPVAWSGPTFTGFGNAAVKLRWTDKPFVWHRNRGREFFMVLEGTVTMQTRIGEKIRSNRLEAGQAIILEAGEEHLAVPDGAARILVVENE